MNTWWKQNLTSPIINYFGRLKEQNQFSKAPILIGGCARSGTSLMLSILSAHQNIFCFPHEVDAFTSWDKNSKPERLDRLYRYLITHKVPKEAIRWCEKRPFNVRYIPQLLDYFDDDFRFIQMIRDPRAVCTSVHPEDRNRYWVEPDRWLKDVEKGLEFKDHKQVLTVRFEDLISDNHQQIQNICKFLDEPCAEEMNDWYSNATVKTNRAWFSELQPIKAIATEGWRDSTHAERIAILRGNSELVELSAKLGYNLLD